MTSSTTSVTRSATASIATGIAVFLAVFAATLYLKSTLSAIFLAAGVALGATATIWMVQFRTHGKAAGTGAWLSAAAGAIMLVVGAILAVAKYSGVNLLYTVTLNAWTTAMPLAAAAIFIGGFIQLPRSIAPWTALVIGGTLASTWATIDAHLNPAIIWIAGLSAIVAAVRCLLHLSRTRRRKAHHNIGNLAAQTALIMVIMVVCSEIMASFGIGVLNPTIVFWGIIAATLLGTIAGWVIRVDHADQPSADPHPNASQSHQQLSLTDSTVQ